MKLPSGQIMRAYITQQKAVWDATKGEMTFMTARAEDDYDIRLRFTFDLAIEGVEIRGAKPAVGVLNSIADMVERDLVDTEAECRRLGSNSSKFFLRRSSFILLAFCGGTFALMGPGLIRPQ
jgi:hypothetical protein